LSSDPDKLSKYASAFPAIKKPYKWGEISDTGKWNKTLEMVDNATADLKEYYNLGEYKTEVVRENWVAKFYLWRSFRYRDNSFK
jgi:hypothetical protein